LSDGRIPRRPRRIARDKSRLREQEAGRGTVAGSWCNYGADEVGGGEQTSRLHTHVHLRRPWQLTVPSDTYLDTGK
jgi:hypothetical protein